MNDVERQNEINCQCWAHCAPKQKRIDELANLLAERQRLIDRLTKRNHEQAEAVSELDGKRTDLIVEMSKVADERDTLKLQIDELKKALYAECRGLACKEDGACEGGYRLCTGCEERAKKAYGEGWGK